MEKLPDSGGRREFSTGSVRDKVDGKGAFHLLSPFALRAYARRMEDGMSKYGERNWERGQPVMTYLDSGLRHINDYVADCMTGEEPKEDHLGAALWNIAAAIHTLEMLRRGLLPSELDNRPKPPAPLGVTSGTISIDEITAGALWSVEDVRQKIKSFGDHLVLDQNEEEADEVDKTVRRVPRYPVDDQEMKF